ncbi:MAG: Ig-like domain-containing protein [Acidobacteriota bacterium]
MRSLSLRLLLSLLALTVAPALLAHDVTINGTQTFGSLDGSSADHDGVANGVFSVNDGNLTVNGVVNCNDDGASPSACNMTFAVSGAMTVNSGGALYAENRSGGGTGGAITLNVSGGLTLHGTAIVSSASTSSSGGNGGAISANAGGNVTLDAGTTIDSGSRNARGGNISIASAGHVSVDGNVLSGPSRTILSTRLTGVALDGGNANQIGGQITIGSTTFVEPAMVIGSNANIITQGENNNGTGPLTIDGCGVQVRGLVAALSRKDTPAQVSIRSGKDLLIDSRDLGVTGAVLGRLGHVRADAPTGTAVNKGVDLFAGETIDILGPPAAASSLFAITSHPGLHDSKSYGGLIRVISTGDVVNASGNVMDAGHTASGDSGGTEEISAKGNVNLDTAVIRAVGDSSTGNPSRGGGAIRVRSYSGNVIWTNGVGEVRPVGSASGLPPADQGSIILTACGTVNTTGSSYPVMGTPTSVFPETHTGVCSPAAPTLPTGVAPLVTCNTPPVANDTSASTNEDNSVTVHLSGSDADGDSLTFTIVSGPSHGSVGTVVSTGPTTADVVYTPALNYNGTDSFVFRANDGNGGTDDATAAITIAPVNDPPSFLIGPTVTVIEDSGPQTIANWATAISPGPADESGQTVAFTVTNDNNALFSVQPSVAPNGTLTFTPASNAYGSAAITVTAHDSGGTANGGNDTSAPQSSSITVTPVNDEPSFVKGADQTVNEDSGAQTVSGWATAISAGPNESSQTLTFHTSNNNNALFSAQPSVSSNGTLTYTPAANANGSATVTVYLTDDGGTANGGDDTSPSQTFTITVNAVNDAPSYTSGGNVTVLEDSGSYSAAWASSISAGPADESGQTVAFAASNDNNALFSTQPSISPTGMLTFTAAANAYGSATVTVTLSDNGGTANGGSDTSPSQTFTITLTPVNDEPSFTGGGNVTVNEDSGAYTAPWATAISAGPNESGQSLTFHAANDNNTLFAVQPSVAPNGVLSFTPAADAFGSATVTVYLTDDGGTTNGGDDTSPSQTFVLTVNSVNDAPSFTSGGNVTVGEDSGAYSAAWATAISAGPANESSQTVSFVVSNNNNALFSVQPAVSSTGVLTFTPASNATGTATVTIYAQDDGGTANGGVDSSAPQTFTITVDSVNDPPSFTPGGNQTSFEDGGPQSVAWATSISAGPGETQNVTFVVSNDNNALFSAQPAISPAGVLTYTAAPNANGSAIVTVYAHDDGGTANGGVDNSAPVTFTITIVAVNDAPAFTSGGDVTVLEDSAAYSAAWATSITAGPADESGQTVTFNIVSNSNPSLFSAGPSLAADGTLSFTPVPNAFGSAVIVVNLQDNGGTANGGADTSSNVTFSINVNGVNDAPSFTPGGNVTVNEDSGAYSASWASAISAGPNEGSQIVNFNVANDNNALFSAQPAISPSGVLTFTPASNAFGTATLTVSLSDNGGTANGGVDTSATVTFTITVNAVNDAPTAGNDTFATFGNTELRVDLAAAATPTVVRTTGSGRGVLDNDADAEGDPISVTSIVGCGDTTAPYNCVFASGNLSMNANGTFSFIPAPGVTSASFQYVVTDQPPAGTPASATGTVTITFTEMIWYVNGSAPSGGNGTSVAPFNSFASLNGSGDVDGPGAYIFVHNSTVAGSIALEPNQHLIGEGVGLTVSAYTLVPAGTKAKIVAAGDAVSVNGVNGVEIAGLDLSSSSGRGIGVASSGLIGASASIHHNVVSAAALQGIGVTAASIAGTSVIVDTTSITSTGNGFDVAGNGPAIVAYSNGAITSTAGTGVRMDGSASGNLFVIGLSNVTIDGNTAGDGININTAKFDAIAGGTFDVVTGGTIAVGSSGNPVGGAGVVMTNVSGDYAIGSLAVFGGNSGVTIGGSGLFTGSAGMRLTSGGGSISAPAGVGLSVTNTTIGTANLNLTSISATGGANGIVLNNTGTSGGLVVAGSGAAGSGGTIANTTAEGVLLTNTRSPSLSFMIVQNSGTDGISATNVNGFTLVSSTVSDTTGTTLHDGIKFREVTGAVTMTSSVVTGSPHDNLDVVNTAGTSSYSITGSTISNTHPSTGNSGINFTAGGTSIVTAFNLTNSTLSGNRADGIQFSAQSTAQVQATLIQNNTFTNNNIGVDLTQNNTASHTANVLSNNFTGQTLHAINVFTGAATPAGGVLKVTVQNNTIGNAGIAGSGAAGGNGIRVNINGGANATVLVDANVIRQTPLSRGIEIIGRNGNGGLDVTVTGNDVNPQDTSGFPLAAIFVQSNCVSVCNTVRSDVRNNTVPAGSTTEILPTFLALVRSGASTLQLVDTPPASPSCTAQLTSTNTGSASASAACTLIPGPINTP